MMRYFLIFLSFLSFSVHANDLPPECRLLPAHVSPADVSADYQPGVDVDGKPVVPADMNGGFFAGQLERIMIPLSVDLAERLNNSNIGGIQLEADLGIIEIYENGRVTHNGQDWTSQIYAICGHSLKEDTGYPGDGQVEADVIKSDAIEVQPAEAVPPSDIERK